MQNVVLFVATHDRQNSCKNSVALFVRIAVFEGRPIRCNNARCKYYAAVHLYPVSSDGTLTNSPDPGQTPQHVVYGQGIHYLHKTNSK